MNRNEKLHKILKYVVPIKNQHAFDSKQISEAINFSLPETNELIRELIHNGDAKGYSTKQIDNEDAIGIMCTVETKDAFLNKKYLKRSGIKYNIYFSADKGGVNLMDLTKSKLNRVVNAYREGKNSFTITGEKYSFKGLHSIKIFTYEKNIDLMDFTKYCVRERLIQKSRWGIFYAPKVLELLGKDITDDVIGDLEYGEFAHTLNNYGVENGEFVNSVRLKELTNLSHPNFDMTKLIRLCEEINDNFSRGNYLSVGMIGRTILNHIPPLFGLKTFNQITANYGGPKQNKSFKKNMEHLNNSLKNIADRYLHMTIRDKETLPNETQIDFRQDLDVLLEEIVRILKK